MSTRAVLCRTNLGIFLLGCEEHIARGRECLSKPLYPLILWKVCSCSRGKEKPSLDLSDSKFPSSQQGGTGIALGRFCWQAEGAAPPPPAPPPPSTSPGAGGTPGSRDSRKPPGSRDSRKAPAERSPLVFFCRRLLFFNLRLIGGFFNF